MRDLLLGREPKDFDVATDASPEDMRQLFRNCRLIGRRFRLAHVHFGREIIEVATFRGSPASEGKGDHAHQDGRITRDNVYGTLEEDAVRRDFTVNSLYYTTEDFSVVDYTGGVADLNKGVLRMIGDPATRYREDPVRILRVVRFAASLGFRIHADTEAPIRDLAHLLGDIPPARLYEETLKLFHGGYAAQCFELLRHYDVLRHLFPETDKCLNEDSGGLPGALVVQALANTDDRIAQEKSVTPGFLFAVLLWEPLQRIAARYLEQGMSEIQAMETAGYDALGSQAQRVTIPRRFGGMTRDVWALQPRLLRRRGKQPYRLLEHPRFRAAYDFLLLRAEVGEALSTEAEWWTKFIDATDEERSAMLESNHGAGSGRRRRRRRPRRE